MLIVPALNAMFDIRTTRLVTSRTHPPFIVFIMLVVMGLVGSIFVGYATAGQTVRSWIHPYGFAAVLAIVLFVIVELEFPRLGLFRVDSADQVLIDLRRSMG